MFNRSGDHRDYSEGEKAFFFFLFRVTTGRLNGLKMKRLLIAFDEGERTLMLGGVCWAPCTFLDARYRDFWVNDVRILC